MKHLQKVRALIIQNEKSPEEKFESIWIYCRDVMHREIVADMEDKTYSRVTKKELDLKWLVSDMLGFFLWRGTARSEWGDLCPAYLDGILEYIDSDKERVIDQGLQKSNAAMKAMEDRRNELLQKGVFDDLDAADWHEMGK